jgi:hypothetical protein
MIAMWINFMILIELKTYNKLHRFRANCIMCTVFMKNTAKIRSSLMLNINWMKTSSIEGSMVN